MGRLPSPTCPRAAVGLHPASGFNLDAPAFEVDSDGPIAAGIDAEAAELTPPAVFTIEPGALQVRIPTTAIGRSPAAFVPQVRQAVVEIVRRAFLPATARRCRCRVDEVRWVAR